MNITSVPLGPAASTSVIVRALAGSVSAKPGSDVPSGSMVERVSAMIPPLWGCDHAARATTLRVYIAIVAGAGEGSEQVQPPAASLDAAGGTVLAADALGRERPEAGELRARAVEPVAI